METKSSILELAKREFKTLSVTEKKFFQAVADGNAADFTTGITENDNPADAQNWKKKRVLKSDRIEWICTDPEASKKVTRKGVILIGLRIDGVLDLSHSNIPFQLIFNQCAFFDSINLKNASIKSLYFFGTHTGPINGDFLNVAGSVFMRGGFKAVGEVNLLGATIGGQLSFTSGEFSNKDGKAINADNLKVKSSVFMRNGFKAEGEVNLMGATIGGQLSCISGEFKNEGGLAINADKLKVESNVFMRDGFKAEGEVNLMGATIGGQLDCTKGEFSNKDGNAINADKLKVESNVFMCDGFKAVGEVNLMGATIGGQLSCISGEFINKGGLAINAYNLKVESSVFMCDGFKAEGEVNLMGGTIGGQLDCTKGEFSNKDGEAINAENLKVESNVFMRDGFKAIGEVNLIGAAIEGHFCWINIIKTPSLKLDLQFAKINTLWDDDVSWPDKGRLKLQGFVYNELDNRGPMDADSRLKMASVAIY